MITEVTGFHFCQEPVHMKLNIGFSWKKFRGFVTDYDHGLMRWKPVEMGSTAEVLDLLAVCVFSAE